MDLSAHSQYYCYMRTVLYINFHILVMTDLFPVAFLHVTCLRHIYLISIHIRENCDSSTQQSDDQTFEGDGEVMMESGSERIRSAGDGLAISL